MYVDSGVHYSRRGLSHHEWLVGWLVGQVGKWTSEDVARGLQDFIICVEMLPMSLAFAYAFGARSFLEPDSTHLLSEIEGLGNVLKNYRVPPPHLPPRVRTLGCGVTVVLADITKAWVAC